MSTGSLREQRFDGDAESGQFGVHFMIDGYGGAASRLADRSLINHLLRDDLPDRLGVHKIADPVVVEVGPQNRKDPGGLIGFALMAESHISLHTFPLRGYISADIYTCQNRLDVETIVGCVVDEFALKTVERHKINRGLSYPGRNIYPDLVCCASEHDSNLSEAIQRR
ncbi:MAG: S-adenosylmethionine decarboxylase [Sedimenticolaceae bacterium]